jgi:outer membrane protein assembly factor BamB
LSRNVENGDLRRLSWGLLVVAMVALSTDGSLHFTIHAPKSTPVASNGAWTEYHYDDGHTGWVSGALDGEIYAEPLIYGGIVYVATLNNSVYALDQSTGGLVWRNFLGSPQTGGWSCGNVSPQGILGTPVVDAAGGRIYVAAFFSDDTYHVIGLSLATGAVQLDTTLNLPNFDWTIEQERGALALHNGYVYVPFGGRFGDCGSYHGYVVGVPTSGSTTLAVYQTPNTGIGIWAAGGPVVDDTTGNVFATTGNGSCNSGVNQNDAVIRLSPTLALQDFFMPNDWQTPMCSQDLDLGGAGPLLIGSSLLFQAGKSGGGYLLNPNNLGGVDGQLYPTPKPQTYSQANVCFSNTNDATFGSFAYAEPYIYLQCNGHGIVALNTNTSAPSFTPCTSTSCGSPNWSAGGTATFGPPIVAGGAVWAATSGGGLYAFNASTGAQMYHSAGFSVDHFATPAEAGGQVFVGSLNVVRTFKMTFLPWSSAGGVLTSGPDAGASSSTRSDVFVRGTDGGMWQDTWNGTAWGAWQPLGGGLSSDPGVVSSNATRIDAFVRGTDNQLWQKTWNGSAWGLWMPQGGILTSGPDADQWGGGAHIDVFARGTDNQLWHKWSNGSAWFGWESLRGVLASDPGSVSWGPNRVDVFVRGTDKQLWHRWYDSGVWYGWEPLGGVLASGPDAASCATGHLDVFVVGTDGGIWSKSYNGVAWSQWKPLGGTWTSDPSAVCLPGTTTIQLFERGTDNALWFTPLAGT